MCFRSFREEQTLGRGGYQAPGWTVGPVAWTQFRGGVRRVRNGCLQNPLFQQEHLCVTQLLK